MIDKILEWFPEGYKGVAVDIGASDGVRASQSLTLEEDYGWTVLCVEPNPRYRERIRESRKLVRECAVADYDGSSSFTAYVTNAQSWEACSALKPDKRKVQDHAMHMSGKTEEFIVTVRKLDTLLREVGLTRLDFLSVDVEGGEEDVFAGFDLKKWMPRVILVEQWPHKHQSLKPMLQSLGYEHIARLYDNDDLYRLAK